ncbi:MAG: xylulokinase [Pseudomonadota bacterium]
MYLGIDLGTSGLKVLLMDEAQTIIDNCTVPLDISHPRPLWSEQHPEDWWQATDKAVQLLKNRQAHALKQVRAISFSGQMHGAVLLDASGHVLRPAILWNDGRAKIQCEEMLAREPQAWSITGNLLMPGFTAPKLSWVKTHEPDIFKQTAKVLLPKDYLRYRISGVFATDLSDASGTSWLDVGRRCWSKAMLAATDMDESYMPQLFEGNQITGTILPAVAQAWGMSEDVVLVAGAGDNAASAVSMTITKPGEAFLSLGTSGVYFTADNCFRPNPEQGVHTFCHCLPNLWHEMTVHLSAASCLDWVAGIVGADDLTELLHHVEQNEAEDVPIFLPYLSGERTPHNDPYARGVFFGMTHRTQPTHLVQAVLEGVAFAFAQGQAAMKDAGVDINHVSVVGGGARNRYWGKILSAALQQALCYNQDADVGAAYGAARLAWLGMHEKADPSEVFAPAKLLYSIMPETRRVEHYQQRQQLFNELYCQLKSVFNKAYKR